MSDYNDYREELEAAPLTSANALERIADALEIIADYCKYAQMLEQQLEKTLGMDAANPQRAETPVQRETQETPINEGSE